MKVLRCPRCGVWPATDSSMPTGTDAAGFTTVTRTVRCPGCGHIVEGDSRSAAFLNELAEWKVNYEELQEPEDEPAPEEEEEPAAAAAEDEGDEGEGEGEGGGGGGGADKSSKPAG